MIAILLPFSLKTKMHLRKNDRATKKSEANSKNKIIMVVAVKYKWKNHKTQHIRATRRTCSVEKRFHHSKNWSKKIGYTLVIAVGNLLTLFFIDIISTVFIFILIFFVILLHFRYVCVCAWNQNQTKKTTHK